MPGNSWGKDPPANHRREPRCAISPPEEATLFDLDTCAWWHTHLSPNALGALRDGWQGLFQRSILRLLARPAETLGAHFDATLGRPTKELSALAGLRLIAECKDLISDAAAEAWSCDASVQFALGLPRARLRVRRTPPCEPATSPPRRASSASARARRSRARKRPPKWPPTSRTSWIASRKMRSTTRRPRTAAA